MRPLALMRFFTLSDRLSTKNQFQMQTNLKTVRSSEYQYMMGPSILVAPVFTGQRERDIVLPNGNWFDFYTGEYAGNGETITIQT